jgi:hypothetical protein
MTTSPAKAVFLTACKPSQAELREPIAATEWLGECPTDSAWLSISRRSAIVDAECPKQRTEFR